MLTYLFLLVASVFGQTCFDARFPRLMGGTSGATAFYTIDIDSLSNIVVGGETSDTKVATIYMGFDPIVVYIEKGNIHKWGKSFSGIDYQRVASIRFNLNASKVIALF